MTETPDIENDRPTGIAPRQPTPQTTARLTRIAYTAALIYAGIALAIVVRFMILGDGVGALIGFLGLGAALAAAFVASIAIRLTAGLSAVTDSIQDARSALARIEQMGQANTTRPQEPPATMLNLAEVGPGNPSVLTAATLDRAVFPRLVMTMDDEPPADIAPDAELQHRGALAEPKGSPPSTRLAPKDLLRMWEVALREGDLAVCRQVYAALVDTADAHTVATLTGELEHLGRRAEESLRRAFSKHVRERDYEKALQIGERIRDLWPDERIARDFERIRPYLLRRVI